MNKKRVQAIFVFILAIGSVFANDDSNVSVLNIISYPCQTEDQKLITYEVKVEWEIIDREKYVNNIADDDLMEMILQTSIKKNLLLVTAKYKKDYIMSLLKGQKDDTESFNLIEENVRALSLHELNYGIDIRKIILIPKDFQ